MYYIFSESKFQSIYPKVISFLNRLLDLRSVEVKRGRIIILTLQH